MASPDNVALLAFVHEILRQRDLLYEGPEYDEHAENLMRYDAETDEREIRRRQQIERKGHRRRWTHRDKRLHAEFDLLEEWHCTDMGLAEFEERARGTRITVADISEYLALTHEYPQPHSRLMKHPNLWDGPPFIFPRTERFWNRFRKESGVPSYLKYLQAAMAEAQASPAFATLSAGIKSLAAAHDAYLYRVGVSYQFSETYYCDPEPPFVGRNEQWDDYQNAVESLLPFLPPGSLKPRGWRPSDAPRFMAEDFVLQPQAAGGGPVDDDYSILAKWAVDKLRGNQRRVVELLAENAGSLPIADVASDEKIGWEFPYDDSVSSLIRELNNKNNKDKLPSVGWRIHRHDNEIRLVRLEGKVT